MPFKKLCGVVQPRSALKSDVRLLPSEAGEFADFTERTVALLKVSATGCIDTGSLQGKPVRSAFFSGRCYGGHASRLLFPRAFVSSRRAHRVMQLFGSSREISRAEKKR